MKINKIKIKIFLKKDAIGVMKFTVRVRMDILRKLSNSLIISERLDNCSQTLLANRI